MAHLVAPLAAVVLSTSAVADTAIGVACKAYAAAVADDYMSDQLVRLNGAETASNDRIIVHSYGRKYAMPRRVAGQGPLVLKSIGNTTREWGKVYAEERRRCLKQKTLGELSSLD